MQEVKRDDGWRLNDTLWARMEPLLPPPKAHPLGCHRPPTGVSGNGSMPGYLPISGGWACWNTMN